MSDAITSELRQLPAAARLELLVDLERRISALQAEQLRVLALIDSDPVTVSLPGVDDKNWAVEDVACALRLSPGVARSRLAEAAQLARLPEAVRSLGAGAITMAHARVLAEATMPLDDAVALAVQDRVIGRAPEQSVGAFRQAVRRAVLSEAAETIEQRRAANIAERRVCLRRSGEGTSELWALLPDEGAAALMSAVTALAQRRDRDDDTAAGNSAAARSDDARTADQRRADALVQLGLDALAGEVSTVLPRQQRLRPAIQVNVALSTLLELDEQPAELAGIGPIPATLARKLAADPSGTWRRLVTDPTGQLLDYGRSTYRPPAALARHVIARDRTCRFPHCTRSADRAELDHTHRWADSGTTTATNLTALCPRHHHLRHETHWNYTRKPDGTIKWTSPTGTHYRDKPTTYPTDHTTKAPNVTNTDPPTDPPTEQNTDPPTDQPIDRTNDPPPF